MYALYDTFNRRTISRHRTVSAAVFANEKIQKRLTNGSYLPTTIRRIDKGNLVALNESEQEERENAIDLVR